MTADTTPIRVLIVDDHELVREGLVGAFAREEATEVTGVVDEGDGVLVAHTHLEGDFPGGVVDLEQRFTLVDGLIADLAI